MAEYHSTSEMLDACEAQVEKVAGREVDSVLQFAGSLGQALTSHFKQAAGTNNSSVIAITLNDGTPAQLAGSGVPLYLNEVVNFYIFVRAKRGEHRQASQKVIQLADALTYDLFDCENKIDDVERRIASHTYLSRRALVTDEANIMAFLVQWEIKPRIT